MKYRLTLFLSVMGLPAIAGAGDFLCAGHTAAQLQPIAGPGAGKLLAVSTEGTRHAIVLFAKFRGELSGQIAAPGWAQDLFDPQLPGSFSHFYDSMSFGKLRVRGERAPRRYEADHESDAYLSDDPTEEGHFGRFCLEILRQADSDINFSRFDNNGPDGSPNSGDDDGLVDVVFLVAASTPHRFLLSQATGIDNLGFEEDFVTDDVGATGEAIRISSDQGTIQRGRTYADAVGFMCHEYGHLLGLPDLYNTAVIGEPGAGPERDSAGIGRWGLMGWGASGWNGDDGPNSFSAWSRMQLGWSPVRDSEEAEEEVRLEPAGQGGAIWRVQVGKSESFLLEYRTREGTHYDRNIPGEGLLIWQLKGGPTGKFPLDLECADGRWSDAGYPQGRQADPLAGGDNLDFWARDETYSAVHGGNKGDQTDPFDGHLFTSFTAATNPSSHRIDGHQGIELEDIRIVGDAMQARLRLAPALLVFRAIDIVDPNRDGVLLAGEDGFVRIRLANVGGVPARDIRAHVASADGLAEVLDDRAVFADLGVEAQRTSIEAFGFPRFATDPTHTGTLRLRVTAEAANAAPIDTTVEVEIRSGLQVRGRVTDAEGAPVPGMPFTCGLTHIQDACNSITGEDGTFAIYVLPGHRSFDFDPPQELGLAAWNGSFNIRGDTEIDIALRREATVRGLVTDAAGIPMGSVSVVFNMSVSHFTGVVTGCRNFT